MRIAIVSNGYFWTPVEPGPSRFFDVAKHFAQAGHEVEVYTTTVQHFEKARRNVAKIEAQGYPFKIHFVEAPLYAKNVDLKRLKSNRTAAKRIAAELERDADRFDAVYCAIPSNRVAAKCAEVAKRHGLPFVVDVEDLWPEAMSMVMGNGALAKLALSPLKKDAEKAYALADAAVGTSDDYAARATGNNGRDIPLKTVYVGCDVAAFRKEAEENLGSVGKLDGEFWVTYAGSIGLSYAIGNLLDAAEILKRQGFFNLKFQILGTGPLLEELSRDASRRGLDNVKFHGYVPHPRMAAYLVKSDVLVNSFAKGAPQSVVNKVGDYFSAGRPTLNTLESEEFTSLIRSTGTGVNVPAEDAEAFAAAVVAMTTDKDGMRTMGENAARLADERFDRKASYPAIVRLVESLVEEKNGRSER